ncbi:MAG: hypothetical protein Q8N20_02165 [Eubacteriales bacterium]|nr:hypothetical protein [Eubacteriales bacterium]MDZ7609982.1 hypothetical protein [Eubacteriales bacterium]
MRRYAIIRAKMLNAPYIGDYPSIALHKVGRQAHRTMVEDVDNLS